MISSAFGKVLQDLAESQQITPRFHPNAGGIAGSGLPHGWSLSKAAKGATSGPTASQAYLQEFDATQRDSVPLGNRLTLDDLKARIRGGLTKQQITKLRRDFARQHHPDCKRVPEKALSTDLMAEANDLLDGAACSANDKQ
ncbi:MAG: hypothetical protein AAGB04_16560 [Pseudomonadota bacterium]